MRCLFLIFMLLLITVSILLSIRYNTYLGGVIGSKISTEVPFDIIPILLKPGEESKDTQLEILKSGLQNTRTTYIPPNYEQLGFPDTYEINFLVDKLNLSSSGVLLVFSYNSHADIYSLLFFSRYRILDDGNIYIEQSNVSYKSLIRNVCIKTRTFYIEQLLAMEGVNKVFSLDASSIPRERYIGSKRFAEMKKNLSERPNIMTILKELKVSGEPSERQIELLNESLAIKCYIQPVIENKNICLTIQLSSENNLLFTYEKRHQSTDPDIIFKEEVKDISFLKDDDDGYDSGFN